MDSVLSSNLLSLGGIEMAKFDLSTSFGGDSVRSRFPLGLQSLTMATPGGVEFDEPWIAALNNLRSEVAVGKDGRSLAGFALGSAAGRAAARFAARSLVFGQFSELLESFVSHGISCALSVVVDWFLLVVAEDFDGWEALDSKRSADGLVLGHIHGSDIDSSLKKEKRLRVSLL